jgi:uncharacterized protein (DUF305 family)
MRRIALSAAAVLTALTLAACGSTSAPTAAPNAPGPMMTAPAADGDHNQADVMFSRMMIPHHEDAIEMAKLAPTRADSADVKALAAQIQAAQQPEIEQMKGWLASWNEPTMPAGMGPDGMGQGGNMPGGAPTGMPGGMMSSGDMAKLEGLSGTEFDREFLTMIPPTTRPPSTWPGPCRPTAATSRPRPWPPTSSVARRRRSTRWPSCSSRSSVLSR